MHLRSPVLCESLYHHHHHQLDKELYHHHRKEECKKERRKDVIYEIYLMYTITYFFVNNQLAPLLFSGARPTTLQSLYHPPPLL